MIAILLAVAATATPQASQAAVPAARVPAVISNQQSPDPARLGLARAVVGAFLPPGSVQKMISSLSDLRSRMMGEMLHVTPKELGAKGAKGGEKTLADIMRERDPYFEQRMAITNRVMMGELGRVIAGFEPELREAMARSYARRFTKTELTDLLAFVRTPSGASFASQMMSIASDPEYQQAMKNLTPRILQAMPGIIQKVKDATASLPTPKDPGEAKPTATPTS